MGVVPHILQPEAIYGVTTMPVKEPSNVMELFELYEYEERVANRGKFFTADAKGIYNYSTVIAQTTTIIQINAKKP